MNKKNEVKVDLSGLERLQRNAEELDGENAILVEDIVGKEFLIKLLEHFDTNITNFTKIEKEKIDEYISSITEYKTWDALLGAKTTEYIKKKLFNFND